MWSKGRKWWIEVRSGGREKRPLCGFKEKLSAQWGSRAKKANARESPRHESVTQPAIRESGHTTLCPFVRAETAATAYLTRPFT